MDLKTLQPQVLLKAIYTLAQPFRTLENKRKLVLLRIKGLV